MADTASFLIELEQAVARGNPENCLRALWHATDVLIAGTYSEDQIWTFGEVIGRLADEIETAARARLAAKLSFCDHAPYQLTRKLAADDCIEVAGPMLRNSQRLDTETLVTCARNQGQQHLLAISQRRSLPEAVTDVLVVRGSSEVVISAAANDGATFSNSGFLHLVRRSEGDPILAESVGLRHDVPRHLLRQLIEKASVEIREKLERERPDIGLLIREVVAEATEAVHARFGPASKDYFTARRAVAKLHERGELTEDKVFEFAHLLRFNETAVAMSLLCQLPVDVVERALVARDREPVLNMARSLEFCWSTTMALLFLGAPNYRITAGELERLMLDFYRLTTKSSRGAVAVYRSRKDETGGAPFERPRPLAL